MNSSTGSIVNAGARLDRLPISWFHYKILLLIAAGALFDAYDLYLGSGVIAATLKEGFSTLPLSAAFMSFTFIGMLIGAGVAGFLGDHFGRRYSYQTNLLIFGLASIAAAFAPNIYWLIGLRFIMGVGLGAELVVAAGTLGEFIPPSHRARWMSMLAMLIHVGLVMSSLGSYYVIPKFGWRWMFASAGIGALLVWMARKSMPESPRWLESKGRKEEAEATLAKIEASVLKKHGALPPVSRLQDGEVKRAPFKELFTSTLIGRTYLASLTVITVNISVYGFVAWLPSFFVQQGFTITKSLGFSLLMSFGAIIGTVLGYWLGDKISRRASLISGLVITMGIGFVYPGMHTQNSIVICGMTMLASLYFFVTIGLYSYVPELFPTQYRLRGTGVAGASGRGGAICVQYVTVFLFMAYGVYGVIALVVSFLGLMAISVYLLRIETLRTSLDQVMSTQDSALGNAVAVPAE
jgi:putative MFS transporter